MDRHYGQFVAAKNSSLQLFGAYISKEFLGGLAYTGTFDLYRELSLGYPDPWENRGLARYPSL